MSSLTPSSSLIISCVMVSTAASLDVSKHIYAQEGKHISISFRDVVNIRHWIFLILWFTIDHEDGAWSLVYFFWEDQVLKLLSQAQNFVVMYHIFKQWFQPTSLHGGIDIKFRPVSTVNLIITLQQKHWDNLRQYIHSNF